LSEAAGAAPLAGALKIRERVRGKKIALVLSGGNVTVAQLKDVLGTQPSPPTPLPMGEGRRGEGE
jgi:threonine dehydratase